jgi:WD40 repeat protein
MGKKAVWWALVSVLLLLLTACGEDENATPAPAPEPTFVPWQTSSVPINLNNAPRIDIIAQISIHNATVSELKFSSDSAYLATLSSGDRRINVWDLETGVVQVELGGVEGIEMLFSTDSEFLYVVDFEQQITQWPIVSGEQQDVVELNLDRAGPVVHTPDNRLVAIGGRRGNVSLLRLDPFEQIATIRAHPIVAVNIVHLSDDGDLLVTMGGADDIKLWDTDTRELIATIEGFVLDVDTVALSPDGRLLAVGLADVIRIFDTARQEQVAVLGIPPGSASIFLDFNADGTQLYFYGENDAVELWDIATTERLVQLGQHNGRVQHAILDETGNLMLTATRQNVFLWDLNPVGQVSATEVNVLRGSVPIPAGFSVNEVVWSPDQRIIAVSDDFGEVFLFGVPDGNANTLPDTDPDDTEDD